MQIQDVLNSQFECLEIHGSRLEVGWHKSGIGPKRENPEDVGGQRQYMSIYGPILWYTGAREEKGASLS